jgi:hypothetical protein
MRKHDPAVQGGHEHAPASREGCAGEAHAPGISHGRRDLERRTTGVRDLFADTEGEVVTLLGADLGPPQDADAVALAIPAVAPRSQRVVIGQQHRICPAAATTSATVAVPSE